MYRQIISEMVYADLIHLYRHVASDCDTLSYYEYLNCNKMTGDNICKYLLVGLGNSAIK